MARLAVLLVCVILAACAPVTAPGGLENVAPAVSDEFFTTHDGLALPLRHWDAKRPRAVIVALHGMNDYSNAFAMPAPYWAEQGITTYAYDQRGFGKAPSRGLWAGEAALDRDLADCLEAIRVRHPGLPVFALGESMGGAVVLTAFAGPRPPRADGVILVAPAVWSRSDMPIYYRMALWFSAHVLPGYTVTGRGVVHIWPSDNIEMLRAFSRDPLVIKATRPDVIWGLTNLMDDAREAAGKLKDPPPILMLRGDKDQVIPPASAAEAAKALARAPRFEQHVYPNGYHMLLRDLVGPVYWKDVVIWIDQQLKASPSPH
jgi:alpha-beta hydrolase superfamily lysophospholipase